MERLCWGDPSLLHSTMSSQRLPHLPELQSKKLGSSCGRGRWPFLANLLHYSFSPAAVSPTVWQHRLCALLRHIEPPHNGLSELQKPALTRRSTINGQCFMGVACACGNSKAMCRRRRYIFIPAQALLSAGANDKVPTIPTTHMVSLHKVVVVNRAAQVPQPGS